MRPRGLMFHHFTDHNHPRGQGAIDAAEFRAILDHVGLDRILPAETFLDLAEKNRLPDGALCLTFDDTLKSQFDVAWPVMQSLGLTGLFFVNTGVFCGEVQWLEVYRHFRTTAFDHIDSFYEAFDDALQQSDFAGRVNQSLERFDARSYLSAYPFYTDADRRFRFLRDDVLGPRRYDAVMLQMMAQRCVHVREIVKQLWMSEDDIRALKAHRNAVGVHSHTHPTRLAELSVDDQRVEYTLNFNHLTRILGSAPRSVAHPCNSYNNDTLAILKSLGITTGFCSNPAGGATSLELGREDHSNVLRAMTLAA
jgi:peptidoglycan/xylan/chitin deacetylase (PgdA/CDA1 family)